MNIFACGIFRKELESLLTSDNSISVHWLDAALHADSVRMKAALDDAIMAHAIKSNDSIRLLFGNGCHPDMCKIAQDCGSRILPVNNCIQAIIGPEKTKQFESNRTMVVTPGWISAWPDIMAGLGWDQVDVRINLGRYDRILLIDTGVASLSDDEILLFYDLVQVPIEIESVDLSYFEKLVLQLLDDGQEGIHEGGPNLI